MEKKREVKIVYKGEVSIIFNPNGETSEATEDDRSAGGAASPELDDSSANNSGGKWWWGLGKRPPYPTFGGVYSGEEPETSSSPEGP